MTDITLALITGADIPIPECQLTIHQPTIKEISQLGETEFFQGIQFLCIPAQENFTSFQIFCQVMKDKQLIKKKEIILDTLSWYRISEKPTTLKGYGLESEVNALLSSIKVEIDADQLNTMLTNILN